VGPIAPELVARHVAELLDRHLEPDGVLVGLVDAEGRQRVAVALGDYDPKTDLPLLTLAGEKGPTLMRSGADTELAVRGITVAGAPPGWIGCPLAAGRLLGAVSLTTGVADQFTQDDLDFVVAVATQAAIALENKQLLALLSAGKREWEQTVDAIPLGICVVDASGAVLRANRAFASMVDVPLTDIAGHPCIALVPPTWADVVGRALADPTVAESTELTAGDRIFHLSVLSRTGTPDGGAALIFDDQTEHRHLQDQLIQSEKMSAIGQLIAGVAHDLNNPLASVIGFSDYLVESGAAKTPELSEPLRAIQQEAERAANIVRNLLTFARKQDHQRSVLRVRQLLSSTLALLKHQFIAQGIEVELDIAPDLPPVCVDANQAQQVFLNLINNAVHAIGTSEGAGRIVIRGEPWLDGVAISVEDDGPGVPDTVADRIFEPFFTTKPEGEGTGLGLSICAGIVKEHGGRLSYAMSALGGAAFRVELPAGHEEQVEVTSVPKAPGALRVLVIDDEPHIQHYMQATLEAWGHEVAIAVDGADGLERATRDPFDVIISDLRMPTLGGREMFEALQQQNPDAAERVVFSTGDTVRGNTLQFLESLGRPYLRKPFSLAELRSVLAAAAARQ